MELQRAKANATESLDVDPFSNVNNTEAFEAIYDQTSNMDAFQNNNMDYADNTKMQDDKDHLDF